MPPPAAPSAGQIKFYISESDSSLVQASDDDKLKNVRAAALTAIFPYIAFTYKDSTSNPVTGHLNLSDTGSNAWNLMASLDTGSNIPLNTLDPTRLGALIKIEAGQLMKRDMSFANGSNFNIDGTVLNTVIGGGGKKVSGPRPVFAIAPPSSPSSSKSKSKSASGRRSSPARSPVRAKKPPSKTR